MPRLKKGKSRISAPIKKAEIAKPKKIIVVVAFGNHRRGDAITDPIEIEKILQSHARFVHVI